MKCILAITCVSMFCLLTVDLLAKTPERVVSSPVQVSQSSELTIVRRWFQSDGEGILPHETIVRLEDWVNKNPSDAEAAYWLAAIYGNPVVSSGREEDAAALLARLVQMQYPPAMSALAARYYEKSNGDDANFRRAITLTKSALEKGDARAFHQMGIICVQGRMGEKGEQKAAGYFDKSASLGYSEAIYAMAVFRHKGAHGYKQDEQKSLSLMRRAAKLGCAGAQYALARFYQDGVLVEKDLQTAFAWAKKSAYRGEAKAMCMLASMYEAGRIVRQDHELAALWSRRAANLGAPEGMKRIGEAYLFGCGVDRDRLRGMAWLYRAARQESRVAQTMYALHSILGLGMPRNAILGRSALMEAAKNGDPEARRLALVAEVDSEILEHVRPFLVRIVAWDKNGKICKRALGLVLRSRQILTCATNGFGEAVKAVAMTYDGKKVEIKGVSAHYPDLGLLMLSVDTALTDGVTPRVAGWLPVENDCFDVVVGSDESFVIADYTVVVHSDPQFIPGLGHQVSIRCMGKNVDVLGVVVSNMGAIVGLQLRREVLGKRIDCLVPGLKLRSLVLRPLNKDYQAFMPIGLIEPFNRQGGRDAYEEVRC